MNDPTPPVTGGGARPPERFFGALLMAIGAMLVLLCGTCTIVFDVKAVGLGPGLGLALIFNAIFGGIPIAIGVGLIFWGRSLYRGGPGSRGDPRAK